MWGDLEAPTSHIAVVKDVTARVRAEAELAGAEERQRLALDAAELGSFRHDLATGRVTLDACAARHLGVSGLELPLAALLARIHPDDLPLVRDAMARVVDPHGDGRASAEHRVVLPSGEPRWLSLYVQASAAVGGSERRPVVVVATTQDTTARHEAEERAREHHERLRGLTSRLERALEDERGRIAAGLHDQVGQLVVACQLKVGALCNQVLPATCREGLDAIGRMLQSASERIGQLTFELSSATLYILGFEQAVEELCEHTEERFGMPCAYLASGTSDEPLPKVLAPTVFRAVRELVFNAVKHSGAASVRVTLARSPRRLAVVVEDDGRGFDVHAVAHPRGGHGGFGLFNIRERLAEIDAELHLDSTPGVGTSATLVIPFDRPGGRA